MKRILIISSLVLLTAAIGIYLVHVIDEHVNGDELILYGNVDVRQVDMGFRVPGQVTQLFFEEGDYVTKSTKVAVMDRTPYDSKVKEAMAKKNAVAAKLKNAEILLKRREELIKVNGVSQEDLDDALSYRDALRADYLAAEAALVVACDELSYTEIFAPTDGVILTRIREPGTVVRESDPVYTLSVSSPVWIRAFVSEIELGEIYYGMEAEITTDVPGQVYKGKIGFISPVAEFTPKTVETTQLRTDLVYRLRIYADNPDRYLKQGMPVTVKLHLNKEEGVKKEKPANK